MYITRWKSIRDSNKEKCIRNKLEQARVACYQEIGRDLSYVHPFCVNAFFLQNFNHSVLKTCAGTVNLGLLQLFEKNVFCKQDFEVPSSFSWVLILLHQAQWYLGKDFSNSWVRYCGIQNHKWIVLVFIITFISCLIYKCSSNSV